MRTTSEVVRSGLRAALPAAVLSGAPSTIHALVFKGDPLEASVAAGSILLRAERRRHRLLIAAVPVHVALSAGWAVILAATLPLRNPFAEGALAGLAIAAIDLGVVGRRYPRVRALRPLPQVIDHLAFGITASIALARERERQM